MGNQRVGKPDQQLEVGEAKPSLARMYRPGPWPIPAQQQLEDAQPGRLCDRLERTQEFVGIHALPRYSKGRWPARSIAGRASTQNHFSPGNGLLKKQIPRVGSPVRKVVTQSSLTQEIE
jgi:hypothetical protein